MAAVAMFNSRQARMIRIAISPRLATRIFLNIALARRRGAAFDGRPLGVKRSRNLAQLQESCRDARRKRKESDVSAGPGEQWNGRESTRAPGRSTQRRGGDYFGLIRNPLERAFPPPATTSIKVIPAFVSG